MDAPGLHTPIVVWTEGPMPWRDDVEAFYLLAGNGLFMCRNHPFFRSCARAKGFPGELELAEPFLEQRFPRVPRELLERAVGFFSAVADRHGSEAGLFLAWNRDAHEVELVVAAQTATISRSWNGRAHAVGLEYELPVDLPPELMIFGDVHSHVYAAAYASGTDVHDEVDKPGLHVVVGRIDREPPELHAEIVVDGTRFHVEPEDVVEGYERRRDDFPAAWMDQVEVEDVTSSWSSGWSSGSAYGSGQGSSYGYGHGSRDGYAYGDGYGDGSGYGQDGYGRRSRWNDDAQDDDAQDDDAQDDGRDGRRDGR